MEPNHPAFRQTIMCEAKQLATLSTFVWIPLYVVLLFGQTLHADGWCVLVCVCVHLKQVMAAVCSAGVTMAVDLEQ